MEAPLLGEIGDAERDVLRGSADRPGWYSKHGDQLPLYRHGNSTFIDKDLEKLYKKWCRSAASRRLAVSNLLGGSLAIAAYLVSLLDAKLSSLAGTCGTVSLLLAASFSICAWASDFQILQFVASLTAVTGTILFVVLVIPSAYPVVTAFTLIVLQVLWIRHWFFYAPRGLGIFTAHMLMFSSTILTIVLGRSSEGTFGAVSVVMLVLLDLLMLLPAAVFLKAWVNLDRLMFYIVSRMNAEGADMTGPEFDWFRLAMDKSFFNTQNTASADDQLQETLADKPFVPVFISGFPRSGTTFTYASLTQALPQAASLGVMDVLEYPQLLKMHQEGLLSRERSAFNLMMEKIGQKTRILDRQPARDWAVEEHGFVLNKFFKVAMITDESKHMFATICRKLLKSQDRTSEVALMKSPSDYGEESQILQMFPKAKFVNIRREPIYVLDSLVNAFKTKLDPPLLDPYGMFLYSIQMILLFSVMEYYSWLFGLDAMLKFFFGGFVDELHKTTSKVQEGFEKIPDDRKYVLHYEELIKDPAMHVRKICQFIGLPPDEAFLHTLKSDPRPRQPGAITESLRAKLEGTEIKKNKKAWWMYIVKPTKD